MMFLSNKNTVPYSKDNILYTFVTMVILSILSVKCTKMSILNVKKHNIYCDMYNMY